MKNTFFPKPRSGFARSGFGISIIRQINRLGSHFLQIYEFFKVLIMDLLTPTDIFCHFFASQVYYDPREKISAIYVTFLFRSASN